MNLVKAKCPNCGGELDVNAEAECLICKYCGCPFIVEKAINNFNTSVTNNVTNNIKADTVVVMNGKSIDALKKRGLELLNPTRIEDPDKIDEKAIELKKIADGIIEQDANNFYGRLFLIDSGDYAPENYNICSKTVAEKEQKMFVDYLVESIDWKLRLLENAREDLIHLQIRHGVSPVVSIGLATLKDMSETSEYAKSEYEKLKGKVQTRIVDVINVVLNSYRNFYYSKDNVTSYEFQTLCELSAYLKCFVDSLADYVNIAAVRDACKKIFEVVYSNRMVIMQNNAIYGKQLLQNCAELSGESFEENDMSEMTKVTVSGLWASKRRMTATLYEDKIVIVIEGVPSREVLKKDILLLNMTQTLVQATMRTTIWYDLVYKLSDETYTLLHFGYDMQISETFFDCEVYKALNSWCITNSIRNTDTKYSAGNPFMNGYNGLTYVDTQPSRGGCYVATCVYGSYDCPQVWVLRRYRDNYLDERWWGRLFIRLYYFISPKIIKLFGKTRWFRTLNKSILDKKVEKLKEKGYQTTAYKDKY